MTRARGAPRPETAARPRDRKQQIAAVAGEAFGNHGYHSVTISDIARAAGISGPALYRHFPNKYALFRHVAAGIAAELEDAVDSVGSRADELIRTGDAAAALHAQLQAVIAVTIENRRSAGIYRWESRYLRPDDRAVIRRRVWHVNRRIGTTLAQLRPELDERGNVLLAMAALSTIGSLTVHQAPLARARLETLLTDACDRLVRWDSPPRRAAAPPWLQTLKPDGRRESLLDEAVRLFGKRGYHEVSIDEIAAPAGLTASGLYRYFENKAELLGAALQLAADRLEAASAAAAALAPSMAPREELAALVAVYIRLSFAQRDLMIVYFAEVDNLPTRDRAQLRRRQHETVQQWVELVVAIHPELPAAEARIRVHAALNLVVDLGRFVHFDEDPAAQAAIAAFMLAVLDA